MRNRSAVGRFPEVTLGWGDLEPDKAELVEEEDDQKEGACRRWFRKVCPCCCRTPSDSEDTPDTVEPEPTENGGGEKPPIGGLELDGI